MPAGSVQKLGMQSGLGSTYPGRARARRARRWPVGLSGGPPHPIHRPAGAPNRPDDMTTTALQYDDILPPTHDPGLCEPTPPRPSRYCATAWPRRGPSSRQETSWPRCCSTRPTYAMPPARATCRSIRPATRRAMPSCRRKGRWCCSSSRAASILPPICPRLTRSVRPRRSPIISAMTISSRPRMPGPTRSTDWFAIVEAVTAISWRLKARPRMRPSPWSSAAGGSAMLKSLWNARVRSRCPTKSR